MKKKIELLTEAQIAQFPACVKKWTDIGLCTQPANRLNAEAGVRRAYASANLQAPLKIVWTTSPLAQGLTRAIVLNKKNASVRAGVRAGVGDSGYGQHDAGWICFYDFFRHICALDAETERLQGLTQIAESAGRYRRSLVREYDHFAEEARDVAD